MLYNIDAERRELKAEIERLQRANSDLEDALRREIRKGFKPVACPHCGKPVEKAKLALA